MSISLSHHFKSFGPDHLDAITCGKHKPPKHILHPYAVKTLTANIVIIKIPNKFGHGVSCPQLEENETNITGGYFYFVEAHCNGVSCPPYTNVKELGCVVCSK